jgi:hypothetical protein
MERAELPSSPAGLFRLDRSEKGRRAFSSVLATIIIAAITIAIVVAGSYWLGGLVKPFVGYEKLEFREVYVVKNGNEYVVTVRCVNTGSKPTSIDLIALNGVPTSDYEPAAALGLDFDPLPFSCETGVTKTGTITIQVGATDPGGNKLSIGSTLTITLYTTNGESYPTSVVLP